MHEYDAASSLVERSYPDATTLAYSFDDEGRLACADERRRDDQLQLRR
jgi:YD repeat-containing protein